MNLDLFKCLFITGLVLNIQVFGANLMQAGDPYASEATAHPAVEMCDLQSGDGAATNTQTSNGISTHPGNTTPTELTCVQEAKLLACSAALGKVGENIEVIFAQSGAILSLIGAALPGADFGIHITQSCITGLEEIHKGAKIYFLFKAYTMNVAGICIALNTLAIVAKLAAFILSVLRSSDVNCHIDASSVHIIVGSLHVGSILFSKTLPDFFKNLALNIEHIKEVLKANFRTENVTS